MLHKILHGRNSYARYLSMIDFIYRLNENHVDTFKMYIVYTIKIDKFNK